MHKIILRKQLNCYACKVQIVVIKQNDYHYLADYATEVVDCINLVHNCLKGVLFSEETTCHVSGTVNRHNV